MNVVQFTPIFVSKGLSIYQFKRMISEIFDIYSESRILFFQFDSTIKRIIRSRRCLKIQKDRTVVNFDEETIETRQRLF